MGNSEISIIEALNHIQSWLNAGEYDKVVQGAQEVLVLEPGNQRALSLLKQAEGKRLPSPPYDPLSELQVQHAERSVAPKEEEPDEQSEKRKLFLAMLLPAVIVVLIGGSTIWWLANREREEIIVNTITTGNLPEDRTYLDENEQRLDELTDISEAIEGYKVKNGAYPSVSQLDFALVENGYFEEMPSDPRQDQIDKAGKAFGYIYAVYEGIGGENSVYIVSALFEDSKGFGYAWTKGAPIKNYPDYREFEESNITFIGGDEADAPTVNPENQ